MDQAWRELALRGEEAPAQPSLSYAELGDPCSGCGIHCCRALMIPHPVPAAASNLDFLRFVLGFPGLALGVADDGWHLIVRTACRHLAGGRCAVFGRPERPVECTYLDAWTCTPRRCLGFPRPEGFLRVTLDQFAWLVEPFRFNPEGWITHLPPVRDLRAHIEARWRDARTRPRREARGNRHHATIRRICR